jgi:hypothetical protein
LKLAVCDPFHLLKHAQYRLVGRNVGAGLSLDSPVIEIGQVPNLFDPPSIIIGDEQITKGTTVSH